MCASLYRSFFWLLRRRRAKSRNLPGTVLPAWLQLRTPKRRKADASSVASYTIAPMAVNMGKCSQCLSVDRTIRRHLGTTADLQDFDAEEKDFFKSMVTAKAADKHLQWRTVRASLVKKLAERQIKILERKI